MGGTAHFDDADDIIVAVALDRNRYSGMDLQDVMEMEVMKMKLYMYGLMLVVMASMAMAQVPEDLPDNMPVETRQTEYQRARIQIMNQPVELNSTIPGLEMARVRVQDQEALQAIERNIERISEQRREMLSRLGDLTFARGEDNESVVARGRTEARLFGLINVPRSVAYNIDEQGDMERLPRALDFLFAYESEEQ